MGPVLKLCYRGKSPAYNPCGQTGVGIFQR